MITCPTCGRQSEGNYCNDCGTRLAADPPADSATNIRSPHATFHNTVVVPGLAAAAPGPAQAPSPTKVICPKDGRRNVEDETFDCMGGCGRSYLCLRHLDEEYGVCSDCAAALRNDAGRAQQERAALDADRAHWRSEAQQAQAGLARAQAELKRLEQARAEDAAALQTLRTAHAALEQDLKEWRARAEKAEAELAAIQRKEAKARAAEEARKAAATQEPIWKQIGIELVKIPAGVFLYGENKARVHLDEYYIAKTPVTNAQYKTFVDATKRSPPGHWEGGQIPRRQEKCPVVNVSWEDAQAFCKWAGVRMPDEQEWEKAARGTDGRMYPWGNIEPTGELCNFSNNLGAPSVVGIYPEGASPYGLLDMAGNVWEWCEGWYEVNKSRVLRGGAFNSGADRLRCAYRDWYTPDSRNAYFGFRVASPGF